MERVKRTWEHEFIQNIRCLEHRHYMEQYFLFSAAPILAGAKPGVLVSFKRYCKGVWRNLKEQLDEATNLCSVELYEKGGIFSLLIYDKELMKKMVRSPPAQKILKEYGYPNSESIRDLLAFLKERFVSCKFPHEVGVFLGYPPEDVQAFIEKKGKDYLCCRYWKVYHNEPCAKEMFRCIDEAKTLAIHLINQKVSIRTAARLLAEMRIA